MICMISPRVLPRLVFLIGAGSTSSCASDTPGITSTATAQGQDDSSIDDSSSTDSGPTRLPSDQQPGWRKLPYGSCPFHADFKQDCGPNVDNCLMVPSFDMPMQTICMPKCEAVADCAPLGDRPMRCWFGYGCYAPCEKDEECPEGMICINQGGTMMCGWKVLWEEP